jgi:pimeloyl-ACP methyl ester carboxylesterase
VAGVAAALLLAGCAGEATVGDITSSTSSPAPSASATAPSSSATPSASTAAGLDRFYSQTLRWSSCGGDAQCATLLVPLDYDDPSGATIELALLRVRSADDSARLGSLVLNPGGPGGSGVDYARAARAVVDPSVRQVYDIVGFDPRGVGDSAAVDCLNDARTDAFVAADGSPDTPGEVAEITALSKEFAAACAKKSPEVYAHVSTRSAARDVDILRAALGDEKLNWLGLSYGTYLGATYAELFPERVGRMVLDGAIDPSLSNVEVTRGQAKGFDLALRRFVEDCNTQADCPLPRGTAAGIAAIQRLFARSDANPLPTGDDARPLTQAMLQNAVLSYLYFPPTDWEQLRWGLESALQGDGSLLLAMLDARMERDESGVYNNNGFAALYAVNALDRPDRPNAAESAALAAQFKKEAPVFGEYLAWGNLPFQFWSAPADNEPHPIAAPGTGPILVVGTTYDPATPYPWAQALAKQLDEGVLLTRVGDGHTGYGMGSACTDKAIDRYLVTGEPPADGTVCR